MTTLRDLQHDLAEDIKRYFVDLHQKDDATLMGQLKAFVTQRTPVIKYELAEILVESPSMGYFEGDLITVSNVYQAIEHALQQELLCHAQEVWNNLEKDYIDEMGSLQKDGYEVRPYENHFNIYHHNETYHEGLDSEVAAWWWLQQGNAE